MLLQEALRKDPHSTDFLESLQGILPALAPVFDRAPKYAWIAKQLLEPERAIQFRVVSCISKRRVMYSLDERFSDIASERVGSSVT